MIKITGKNLIGSEVSAKGNKTFSATNPVTQTLLDTLFYEATPEEIERTLNHAENAFHIYRLTGNENRARFLETIADEIGNLGDILIKRCMSETGLPEVRLTGERTRTINQLRLFAGVVREGSWVDVRIDTAIPDRQPTPRPDIRQIQIPLGVVGVFGASNFPLAFSVAGGDTASALAAGCTVVVKAHPLHPGTSELVAKAILTAVEKTGMPDGTFSLLQGQSTKVGMAIVRHEKTAAIGFTGSFKGGKALYDAANQRPVPIPVFAEMGSINPIFILPGAMKTGSETIAKGLICSFTLGVGQFCTNPGLVVTLKNSDSERFQLSLQKTINEVTPGYMLSEQIRKNYLSGVEFMKQAKGVIVTAQNESPDVAHKVQSLVFTTDTNSFLKNKSLSGEVFGPSTLIVTAGNKEEMLRIAAHLEGHLTATIHGSKEDLTEYNDLVRILERKVGRLIFNGFPTGVEVCHSMVHGGPFPATTASQTTSVGTSAIRRFVRPLCYQDFPSDSLPDPLKNDNPQNLWRLVNGIFTKDKIE